MIGSARPAGAGGLASDKVQAATLLAEQQSVQGRIGALGQLWDFERSRANQLSSRIHSARLIIARDKLAVTRDRSSLQDAAVNAYVNSGSVASTNPLFAANANQLGATSVYNQVAEGNLAGSVADLTNAQTNLAADQRLLNSALRVANQASATAANARQHAIALSSQLNAKLAAANAQVHADLVAQQQAVALAAQANFSQRISQPQVNFPAPPPDSRGNIAVDFALSFLNPPVPYVWGGASRAGVDCSGLTMLAWGAAGVSLPHYSGGQMADSAPVPVSDLQPGDLLFYGPGGSEHVAMYVGHGTMIEAPFTGENVQLTPVRLGYGFAGAGRP